MKTLFFQCALKTLPMILGVGICHCVFAQSNIVMDGRTGAGTGQNQNFNITHPNPNQIIPIEGGGANPNGTIVQGTGNTNLFYSFDQFNITNGDTARFQCTGCVPINNIISRVTGGNVSNINGTLQSTVPNANFWMINPNGITFGGNTQITVPAAFHIGTADSVLTADKNAPPVYSTDPASTLTAATPAQFGFGTATGDITINGSNITLNDGSEIASARNMTISNSRITTSTNVDPYSKRLTLSAPGGIQADGVSLNNYYSNLTPTDGVEINDNVTIKGNISTNSSLDNHGSIQGNATAGTDLWNDGTIQGNATATNNIQNSSFSQSGLIQGNAIAINGGINNGVSGDGTYPGVIEGNTTANTNIINDIRSEINGNATANNNIVNYGTIQKDAIAITGSLTNGGYDFYDGRLRGIVNGNATAGTDIINDQDSIIKGNATANNNLFNAGTIQGNAIAKGFLYNSLYAEDGYSYYPGTINGNAIAGIELINGRWTYLTNINGISFIGGNATANHLLSNHGTIQGNATANNSLSNSNTGTIQGNATADNFLSNTGTIQGNATATKGSLYNGYYIIPARSEFRPYYKEGTINGNATAGGDIINNTNSTIGSSRSNQIIASKLINNSTINGDVQLTSTLTNNANAKINGNVTSTHTNTDTVNGDFFANELNNNGAINGNTVTNINNQGNITGNAIADTTAFTGNGTTTGIKTASITNNQLIQGSAIAETDIVNNTGGTINNGAVAGNDLTNSGIINGTTISAGRNLTNQNNGIINSNDVKAGGTLKVTNGATIKSFNTGDFNLFSGGQFIVDNNGLIVANNTGDFSITANGLPLDIAFNAATDKNLYAFRVSDGGKIQKSNSGNMNVIAKTIFLNGIDSIANPDPKIPLIDAGLIEVEPNVASMNFYAVPENKTNRLLFPGYFKMKDATMTNVGTVSMTGYYLNLDPSGIKSEVDIVLNVSNPQEIVYPKVLIGKGTSLFAFRLGKDFLDYPTKSNIGDPTGPTMTKPIPLINTNFLPDAVNISCEGDKSSLIVRKALGYMPDLSYQVNYPLLTTLGGDKAQPALDLNSEAECYKR